MPYSREDLIKFFEDNSLAYERFDHPAVFTCEEVDKLGFDIPGANTKNLFLRNKRGDKHYLVSVPHEKNVDLKSLGLLLGNERLSFASAERLMEHLGLEPGSVTILGVINDGTNSVEVFIDREIWDCDAIQCHPLVNTSTVVMPRSDLERFLSLTRHVAKIIDVPARVSSGVETP